MKSCKGGGRRGGGKKKKKKKQQQQQQQRKHQDQEKKITTVDCLAQEHTSNSSRCSGWVDTVIHIIRCVSTIRTKPRIASDVSHHDQHLDDGRHHRRPLHRRLSARRGAAADRSTRQVRRRLRHRSVGGLLCLPNLAYFRERYLPTSAEDSSGPTVHPRINHKVTRSSSEMTTGVHSKNWNHIHIQAKTPTLATLVRNTHSWYSPNKLQLREHINPDRNDQRSPRREDPGNAFPN